MAQFSRLIRAFSASRRAIRAIERVAAAVEEQNKLLARLADQFAPLPAALEQEAQALDKDESSVSFLNDQELADALEYSARMQAQTGRTPTDEEIVVWLSERQTVAHNEAMNERGRR